MWYIKVFLFLGVQLYFLDRAIGCRCAPYLHSQNAFCDNNIDFVMKAKIKKKTQLVNEIKFKLKVKQTFKTSLAFDSLPNKAKRKVFTLVGSSACEAGLNQGDTYVFTGKVGSGKLWVSSCDYIKLWSDLIPLERDNFKNNYIDNCNCDFDQVGGAFPGSFAPTTCILISTQVSCGIYAWCQCSDVACSMCSMVTQQPQYSDCTNMFPPPP